MNYEHAVHVAADPDRVFEVLADTENLVQFVPQLTAIHREAGDRVDVEARYEGHTQRGAASLRAEPGQRRVEWGTEGTGYRGSLTVSPDGQGSRLALSLSTAHERDLDHDVAGTLEAVRMLLEARL